MDDVYAGFILQHGTLGAESVLSHSPAADVLSDQLDCRERTEAKAFAIGGTHPLSTSLRLSRDPACIFDRRNGALF